MAHHHRWGEPKLKRCLYLTGSVHEFLVDLGKHYRTSPSDVAERLLRSVMSKQDPLEALDQIPRS